MGWTIGCQEHYSKYKKIKGNKFSLSSGSIVYLENIDTNTVLTISKK